MELDSAFIHGTPPSLRLVIEHACSLGLLFSFPFSIPCRKEMLLQDNHSLALVASIKAY